MHTVFDDFTVPENKMPTARIRVRILDSHGLVPAGARLSIDAHVLRRPQWGSVDADARGYVESGSMPPGTYKLRVHARDCKSVRLGEHTLHPHEVLDLDEVRMSK